MARIYGSTNNSNWGLFVDLNETSYSVGNNNSNVRASVYLYRTSSASYYGGSATIGVTVNGEYKSTGFYPSYPTNIGAGEDNAHLVATFDFTVPHNADGSKTASMSMSWSANFSPSSGSASGSISLTNIPRQANITSATDFTDEENPTITYENKAGNSVSSLQACISLTGSADDIEYRDIPKTGSSYTFELTDSERNILRNATLSGSTQRQVIFFVRTEIGGNTFYSTLTRTLTIVNCSPTVTATIEDINTATLEITGSSSSNIVIVKGYSKAKITPTAAAKKGASITSIKVNDTVVSKESIELSGTDKYEVRAYDNRGLVASKDLVGGTAFTFINYIPLTFSGTLERHTPTGNQLDLSFSGNYFNGSFGTTDNSLTIKWYWKEKNAAEWTLGGTLVKDTDFVINNNVYHSGTTEKETKISLGNIFDYKKTYEIKIEYSDALLKNNSITLLGRKGKPVYNWGRDFFNINGELRINGVNPFGYKPPLKIASVALRGNVELPAETYKTIPYSKVRHLDENLTLNNRGGVEINVDCTFAIVIVRQRTTTAGSVNIGVQTNNNPLYSITNQYSEAYAGGSSTFLLPVTKGDIIYTAMYSPTATEIFGAETNDFWVGMDIILI